MAKIIRSVEWYIHVTMAISIILIVTSFFIPPWGVIDGSILAAIGELGGMAAIFSFLHNLPRYIETGATARITHGNTSVEIGKKEEDNFNNNINEEGHELD